MPIYLFMWLLKLPFLIFSSSIILMAFLKFITYLLKLFNLLTQYYIAFYILQYLHHDMAYYKL